MKTLTDVLSAVFDSLDQRVQERWSIGNLAHGFWRAGTVPKMIPVDTMQEYGFWQAHGDLSSIGGIDGLSGQCSVALIGGHTRIGVFIPNRLLEGVSGMGESLTNSVSKAHDGQATPIVRHIGGDTLFDHILSDAPFSADWILRCTQDHEAENILRTHLAWRVIDIWESAMRTLMSRRCAALSLIIASTSPLPAVVTEALPLILQDVYEIQSGRWITSAEVTKGDVSLSDLEARLQNLLPDHGITVQKEAFL